MQSFGYYYQTNCSGHTRQPDFDAVSVTSTSEARPAKPFKNPEYKAKRDKTLKQILTAEKNSYAGLEVPICMSCIVCLNFATSF